MTPDTAQRPVALATPPSPPSKKSYGWVWIIVLCLSAGAAYFYYPKFFPGTAEAQSQGSKGGGDKGGGGRAVPVVASLSRQGDMPVYLNGLGSVTAFNTVTVR